MCLVFLKTVVTTILLSSFFGTDGPPQPTPEIKAMIEKLGDPIFVVREEAEKELRTLRHKSIRACLNAANFNENPEIRQRSSSIVKSFYNMRSNDKNNPLPSIWLLNDKIRFPHGVNIVCDKESDGWCKEMSAPLDLSAYYFALARRIHNENLSPYELENDGKVCGWLDYDVEREATRLLVRDLLHYGRSDQEIKALLNEGAERTKKKFRNMYRHYSEDGLWVQRSDVIPGPACPENTVPESNENRFSGAYQYREGGCP